MKNPSLTAPFLPATSSAVSAPLVSETLRQRIEQAMQTEMTAQSADKDRKVTLEWKLGSNGSGTELYATAADGKPNESFHAFMRKLKDKLPRNISPTARIVQFTPAEIGESLHDRMSSISTGDKNSLFSAIELALFPDKPKAENGLDKQHVFTFRSPQAVQEFVTGLNSVLESTPKLAVPSDNGMAR